MTLLEEAIDAITLLTASITIIAQYIIMLGLAALAYWRGDRPLFLVSGLFFIVYGFTVTVSIYYSMLLVLAGFFLCARAFTERGMDKWTK